MTRGLYPPDTLSQEDIGVLKSVRRDIWSSALIGGVFGASSGLVAHTGFQWARKFGFLKALKLNRNTAMLSVLGGGAFGMFLFAAYTGKQEVHYLHPIFQVGADPKGDLDYQRRMMKAREQQSSEGASTEEQGRLSERESHIFGEDDDLDIQKLEQIRVVRRKSLMDTLEHGHGLSDSHGGHWDHEAVDRKKLEEIRLVRRRSLMENLERGHGLSDSHGGHWVRRNGN